MQWLPLSESESKELTELVVCYQQDRENTTLYRKAHTKTQQLLYALPEYLHLLEEEDCCDFLFFCYETIDYYLQTYRIGRLSYIGYLTQVVRKRSKYFITKKKERIKRERLVQESERYQYQEEVQPEMTGESAHYTPFNALLIVQMESLPELFNQLLHNQKTNTVPGSPKLQALKEEISNPVNRRRFLIVLTLSPNLANQYLLEELADLLDVDPILLNRYLNTAGLVLEEKEKCKQEFLAISNRHFRRLLEIEEAMQLETDEEKYQKLEALRIWTVKVYKAKVNQIRNMEFRLSHSQLGALLNIPKGTIDSSVHYMKRLLKRYMDETQDNEYL
ncbi:MAG: hypothetical protein ACQ5SW_12500 [Sphaerochaetaceae bacterium]